MALVFLSISLRCFPQDSTGIITGTIHTGKEKLELASVSLLKTSFSATTDSAGHFEIGGVPYGRYQLKVSYVGYENFQQEVVIKNNNPVHLKIEMVPLAANLKELVISGTLKEVTKLQSITPVDVYTSKYFLRTPSSNLWDALQNVNGVFPDIDNGVSNTTDIQLNGLEGNYTMILLDGVPAMNGLAGIYTLNALPMSIIDKVEIVRGAASSIFGSDAIAGVINIKTKNPATAPSFTANVLLNSMLDAQLDLTGSFRLKKANGLIAFSGEGFDYKWDRNGDGFMDIPLTNRVNFFNKWTFDRTDNRVATIYARYLFEDRYGGQMSTPGHLTGSTDYYSEWIRTHQWQAGFQYQFPVKEKVLLSADYSEHYQEAIYGINYYQGAQRSVYSQITWSKKVDRVNELLLGATYRMKYYNDNTSLSSDSLTGYGKYLHVGGLFLEDELTFSNNHKLLVGARFEYNNFSGPVGTPRIIYKWNSNNEKNVIRIGFGTGYRVPNVLNEGFGALNGSRTIEISEKLKSEYVLNGNGAYTRLQELPAGLLNIDASVFCTYFTNYVEPDYTTDPTKIIYSNNKGALGAGFSLNADFTFNYPLKVGVGLTYTHIYEIDEDDKGNKVKTPTLHSPYLTGQFYLSYNFPVPQLSIDWTGTLTSPMLLATVPNDYRPSHSPWFTIQNIQITKKFSKGIEIYAGIKNLFNFIQKDLILRPFDPFNQNVAVNNPYNYRFDTTYGFTSTEGIKGFVGFRYTMP